LRTAVSGKAAALVVGVYPSAFHVAWSPPETLDPRLLGDRKRPFIASLAVDVEPTVFWGGASPEPGYLLAQWKAAVGFEDGEHGTVRPGSNGPSGAGLVEHVLDPLGLEANEVAFTDAVPWYFVTSGKGSQREAIRERFGPIARHLGLNPGGLPVRPSPRRLVDLAGSKDRRKSFQAELKEASAPLIITLGEDALAAVRAVATVHGVPGNLSIEGYGTRGTLNLDGHTCELLPLVHPGFQRQLRENSPSRKCLESWVQAQATEG
jgi:hypothetical protein